MSTGRRFFPLTPDDHIDLHDYREALDYVFSNDNIRNIALSGAYGSGKSSVIRSYENIHKERNFIHISLAHFDEQGQVSGKTPIEADSSKTVHELEGKILNQLIHQIPHQKISQSHFRIKKELPWPQRLLLVTAALLFAALLVYVFRFQTWSAAVAVLGDSWLKTLLSYTIDPYARLAGVLLAFAFVGVGLFYLSKVHNFQNIFKKVDLKGIVGIEIFENSDDSYFDKYLNEVLYLFENSEADAIVFEDLDRYDVTLIFEKLREISDLLCQREKAGLCTRQKPLRFFYLIRDDIFTASDRSKFFDFIIPVVPYVDASNSCDKLLQQFDDAGFGGVFSKRFLQDVSLYLSDMRLVTNIVNEYIVYSGRLQGSGLETKPDRQLAMLIYKNLYPGDFNLLQKNRGYVYNLLENKKTLIKKRQAEIDGEIAKLRQQIADADREALKSIDELNALYFPLKEQIASIDDAAIDGGISRTELIRRILQKSDNVTYYPRQRYPEILDVASKRAAMEANPEYCHRKELIENKSGYHREQLEETISRLERERIALSTMSIKELLGKSEKEDEEFWNSKLPNYEAEGYADAIKTSKGFNLLKYLIRNGYIDENYAAYVSYFYPNSLTAQDRNFLLALSDRKSLGYDYHLERPEDVLHRLDDSDFTRKELRNFDLLEYLLHRGLFSELRTWFQACNGNEGAYKFLLRFWRLCRERETFIYLIGREQPAWFEDWSAGGFLNGFEWRMFALDMLYYLDDSKLEQINGNHWLSERISSEKEFLKIDIPDIERIVRGFRILHIRFRELDYREEDLPLVDAVYRENFYALNIPMLKTFMAQYWGLSADEVEQRSYTHLRSLPDEPLSRRIAEDMEGYISVLLTECGARFFDDEDAVIELLNNKDISEESKRAYIERLDTVLNEIDRIKLLAVWPSLLEHRCVKCTWENIADYFVELSDDKNGLRPELADFIDSGTEKLGWNDKALNDRIDSACADRLRLAVIQNTTISLDRYRIVLADMTVKFDSFSISGLPDDRMKVVLELRMVAMTAKNVEFIRENYPHLMNDFVILRGAAEFAKLAEQQEIEASADETVSLLEDRRMDEQASLRLVNVFKGKLPLEGRSYSPSVKAKIVEEHLDEGELPWLIRVFSKEDVQVRTAFLSYAKEHVAETVEAAGDAQYIPVEVYAACLEALATAQALELRPLLANPDFEVVCTDSKKPKFPNTQENRAILNYFASQSWISSYAIQDGTLRAYPKRK